MALKLRKPKKITSRISSVTNGFVQAIIPTVMPVLEEASVALRLSGIKMAECVYCGRVATDWDHLRPLVKNRRPSGYLNEIRNLVPCCGPCNQSKSGHAWEAWMLGSAPGSPRAKGVRNIPTRIARLKKFEKWGRVKELPFEKIVGRARWKAYWAALHEVETKMRKAQILAEEIQKTVEKAYLKRRSSKR